MAVNHIGELHVGRQTLPLEARAPILEEAPRPALTLIVPELAEGLLEEVGGVQALVGREQGLECFPAISAQVLLVRQQGVLLALDVPALLAGQPGIFALADLVQRLTQVAHDMELVEQDGRLGRLLVRDVAKRFPHIHHREANAFRLVFPEPVVKLAHAGLGAVLTAEPDRPAPDQIADHDTIGMPLADRDLVDADRLGTRCARTFKLRPHVLLLQRLHRVPVELQFPSHVLNRRSAYPSSHVKGKALRVQRVVGQKVQPLAFHLAAASAGDSPDLQLQVHAGIAARQVAHPTDLSIVPTRVRTTASTAECFFDRRTSVMIRAFGSPKMPRTCSSGRKPANRYASRRRLRFVEVGIGKSCQISATYQRRFRPAITDPRRYYDPISAHTITR